MALSQIPPLDPVTGEPLPELGVDTSVNFNVDGGGGASAEAGTTGGAAGKMPNDPAANPGKPVTMPAKGEGEI